MLADLTRHFRHRRGTQHRHHHGLEQQREAAALTHPRHTDQPDPAGPAANARHARVEIGFVWKKFRCRHDFASVSWIGHSVAPQPGQANRAPLANVMSMSSRRACASKRLPDTTHGAASPKAVCNRSVSRMDDGSSQVTPKPCQTVRQAQTPFAPEAVRPYPARWQGRT
jgi:hypothetical protein